MPETHRGSMPSGAATDSSDRRVVELIDVWRSVAPAFQGAFRFVSDVMRTGALWNQQTTQQGVFVPGVVIQALPHYNWYKVQVANGVGVIGACMLGHCSFQPLGVRDTSPIPPNSSVLVYMPPWINFGIIIGVLPERLDNGNTMVPGWLVQGSQCGIKREDVHLKILTDTYLGGGVIDFSSQRPLDGTIWERGWITETGIALMMDSHQAFLRVHEACGLFLNRLDSYTRLAGVQLDLQSGTHLLAARLDEGEPIYYEGAAVYAHENLGLYGKGESAFQEYDSKEVHYTKPVGKLDLSEEDGDLQQLHRYQEYGGYLGQGRLRLVLAPTRESGRRLFSDEDNDEGLFCESIALDGDYALRSAKGVYIGKRPRIVVPRRLKLPEDPTGDDAQAEADDEDGYKFAGLFGEGEDHEIGDLDAGDDSPHLLKVAAVMDLITHLTNWKALHPFHYHTKDFRVPQESEQDDTFDATVDVLDFSELAHEEFMSEPDPVTLHIDHRYGDVDYFQREAYFKILDDGGIALGCGYGSQIVMTAGNIELQAPGDVRVLPGRRILMLGGEFIARVADSVDISSSQGDVRLKSEYNFQVLAGNSGVGGLLLECKSEGNDQKYEDQIGEDVEASGIVLKTADGVFGVLAKQAYVRTGINGSGGIVLDAGQGQQRVSIVGSALDVYHNFGVHFWEGPTGNNSAVLGVHSFSSERTMFSSDLIVTGGVTAAGDLVLDGKIEASGNINAAGRVSDRTGDKLGEASPTLRTEVEQRTQSAREQYTQALQDGEPRYQEDLIADFYDDGKLGNETLVQQVGFSYRDDDEQEQYRTGEFMWVESRWQQLLRFELATGGVTWEEPAVEYQGRQLLPWPGRELWAEDTFWRLKELKFFDPAKATARDRPDPYTEAELADWEQVAMKDGFKLIRTLTQEG